ncbi:MAG TPA: hypothetical protein PKO41_01260 [Dokdonella sp.]|uniref:hypothetical protein n=1 Tax=Dokdonella sp. TaxID=2291710 RepID=UPI0025C34218|nr:hypothetical protein [Dokdonella sp.]MBX3692820.1 hypothetical protein [Dokdonella sp.]MCW5568976.1 hypothetical protein [Dokdonella sp.]HNR91030.1 hypothetical protein [Dokdonella sp.]
MRIFVAALLGAIVLFFWQFVSHTMLPIGDMGFRAPQNEDVVIRAIADGAPTTGIYALPYIDMEQYGNETAQKAWVEKAKANRFSFIVVSEPQADPASMGPQLGKQFSSNFLGALIVSLLLGATAWGFGARVLGSLGFGIFGWLLNIVPQWNWYRFPGDYLLGGLLDQGIGWLLAGMPMAWWLGRR